MVWLASAGNSSSDLYKDESVSLNENYPQLCVVFQTWARTNALVENVGLACLND